MKVMRGYSLMLLTVIVLCSSAMHPMHVSVTEIEYNSNEKMVEITTHIFLDDIEERYRVKANRPEADVLAPTEKVAFDQFLEEYMTTHLSFVVNDKVEGQEYLGYELEGDGVWCYQVINGVKKFKSLEVKNSILLQQFDDQINLVHVEYNDDIQSAKMSREERKHRFILESK